MSPENFALWLQGFAELSPTPPTAEQWQSIREHLSTVFKKVTPPVAAPAPSVFAPKPPDLADIVKRAWEKSEADKQKDDPRRWPGVPFERYTLIC